jgi:zinc transport system substrate-binding protein
MLHGRVLLRNTLFSIVFVATCQPSWAADLKVVVTSKPIHSLTAAVMEGLGKPTLLVEGSASPHTFSLKPSGARAITSADVFIRVSEGIEPFTEKIATALPSTVTLVTLADTDGLTLLDKRNGATFEEHGPDAHANEARHGSARKTDHGDHKDHEQVGHEQEGHGGKDGHIWLDPTNAKLMALDIARVLAAKDSVHADAYKANAARLATRIDQLSAEIAARTAPLKNRPFIVFHDAYQYFENRYGIHAAGSVTVSPDVQPSAKRITALRAKIAKLDAACVFAEPLFQPNLVAAVTEGTSARAGTLDPEGVSLEPGPDLYFTLMRTLADNLVTCLKPAA